MTDKEVLSVIRFILFRYVGGACPTDKQLTYALEDWRREHAQKQPSVRR